MKRKLLSLLLSLAMLCAFVPNGALVATAAEGDCTWDDTTKTLTITATDFTSSNAELTSAISSYDKTATKLVINTTADIPASTFSGKFVNVTDITITNAGDIGYRAFYNVGNGSSITRNITITNCGNIGQYAFQRSNGAGGTLNITKCGDIGQYAFYSSKISGKVTITECGDIGQDAFRSADNSTYPITELYIGTCGNITNLVKGSSSFIYLKEATFNNITGTITADDGLLNDSTSLETLTINKCGDIPAKAFSGLTYLTTLTIGEAGNIATQRDAKLEKLETLKIGKCGTIARFVNEYSNTYSLKEIEIGTCTSIDKGAFSNNNKLSKLESISIGSCDSIGDNAFNKSPNLKALTIGTCSSIGSRAFNGAGSSGDGIDSLTLSGCSIGSYAFQKAKIKSVTLKDITSVGSQAFAGANIENATLDNVSNMGSETFSWLDGLTTLTVKNVDTISDDTFKQSTTNNCEVETLTLENVNTIGAYAFTNFKNLKTVNISGTVGLIGAHAFSGCDALKTINIQDETKLAYSDSFVNQTYVKNRVTAILKNGFDLDPDAAKTIEAISPEGWTSVKIGEKNSTSEAGDTQITIEAKWTDTNSTVANVLVKAYYTIDKQMDFIFVADCSNSMAGIGSNDAMNSNFYNMQSKLMDVTDELLSSGNELDTQVAYVTFGETEGSASDFYGKSDLNTAENYIWNDIVNYNSNTNYSVGFEKALELVKQNKAAGRNTTVIFVSDGQPYGYDENGEQNTPEKYYGKEEAKAIRDEGVQIVSVLQQVPEDTLPSSEENMNEIADKVFSSSDLAGFSKAINDAIDYAYSTCVITTVVHPDFTLDESSLKPSVGKTSVSTNSDGNTVIRWVVTEHSYELLTLDFIENLKPKSDGTYPVGNFDTQLGYTMLSGGLASYNQVESPVLPREELGGGQDTQDKSDISASKTGDDASIGLFIAIACFAILGMLLAVFGGRCIHSRSK